MKLYAHNTPYPPMEELACGSGTAYVTGAALYIASGVAALCTGTTTPTYLCQAKQTGVTGENVQAVRITDDMIFSAPLNAAISGLTVGTKLKLHTDAVKLVALSSGETGVIEVVGLPNGSGADAEVLVRIV